MITLDYPPLTEGETINVRVKHHLKEIRQRCGSEVIIRHDKTYHFNRQLDYSYDIETVWATLRVAEESTANSSRQQKLYKKAIDLYAPPLCGFEGTWVEYERVKLEQAIALALQSLIESYCRSGDYLHALIYCERWLEIDPCAEQAYVLAMKIERQRGSGEK